MTSEQRSRLAFLANDNDVAIYAVEYPAHVTGKGFDCLRVGYIMRFPGEPGAVKYQDWYDYEGMVAKTTNSEVPYSRWQELRAREGLPA